MSDDLHRPRPFCDWHEDRGDVLWWLIPVTEAPYLGSPLDTGLPVVVGVRTPATNWDMRSHNVGGWPFTDGDLLNLWWTPLPDAKRIEDQVPL